MIDLGPDVSNLISATDVSNNYVKLSVYNQKTQEIDASIANKANIADVSNNFVKKTDWDAIFSSDADSDNVINKWNEVVDFLEGMGEDTSLGELLMDKASKNDISAFMDEDDVSAYLAEHGIGQVDMSEYYTKTQIDTSIAGNYYDKAGIDTSIANNYYSKTQSNAKFAEIVLIDKSVADQDPTVMNDTSIYFILQ